MCWAALGLLAAVQTLGLEQELPPAVVIQQQFVACLDWGV